MMNIQRIHLGLLTTAVSLGSLTALADDNFYRRHNQDSDYDYQVTETYSGNQCKSFSGGAGESDFGSYQNSSNQESWVHCPIVNHNDPYQDYIRFDVQVYDPNPYEDFDCNARKRTPANNGGWSLYQGSSAQTWGYSSRVQTLSLGRVPGGWSPYSHIYVQCKLPGGYDNDYATLGNYAAY